MSDDSLPVHGPDPRQLPAPSGELFRRQVRAETLLNSCDHVDPERRAEIGRELILLGASALPALQRAACSPVENTAALSRSLLRLMVPDDIGRSLCQGLDEEQSGYAIEVGAMQIARLGHPTLDPENGLREIDDLARKARQYVYGRLCLNPDEARSQTLKHPLPVVEQLAEFWRDQGFHGNNEDFYSEKNSYVPDVLERRTGLPISLSIVYLALARRLHLKADGVGMPGHFIARVRIKFDTTDQFMLVDPFYGARPLTLDECKHRVESTGQPFMADEHLKATPVRDILIRMCNNLLALFDHQKKSLDAERVATVLQHLQPGDPVPLLIRAERRLRRNERRGARADFERVKELDPKGPIGRTADELLRRMDHEYPFR